MKNNSNILIAGFGYIGSALGEKLVSLGFSVHGIKRNHKKDLASTTDLSNKTDSPSLVKIIACDLSQPLQLEDPYHTVFYLVAADSSSEESYKNAYEDGIKNLIAAFHNRSLPLPKLIVFVSSSSVYAENDGGWVDESSAVKKDGFSAKSLLKGESMTLESGIPAIVVRFSGIYGPNRTYFKDSVLLGQKGLLESSHYTNRIHRDDCVQSLIYLMQYGKHGEIYNVTDSNPADYNEVVSWLCHKAGIDPAISRTAHNNANNNPNVLHYRSNKKCSNQKLLRLGYKFLYPSYKEGYE